MRKQTREDMNWEILGLILVGLYASFLLFFGKSHPFYFPQSNDSSRSATFDILRGFAMIGIVMIHIHSYFNFFHPKDVSVINSTLLLSNFSRFSVPAFIFTSAIFLSKKQGYWKSKILHLALPYFLASAAGYFVKYSNHSLYEFLNFLVFGKVFTPFYFVPLLFQFYFLFFLASNYIKKTNWIPILFITTFVINLLSNLNYLDQFLPDIYNGISIFNYIFFFYIGLIFKNIPQKKTKNDYLAFFALHSIVLIFLAYFSFQKLDFKNHHIVYPILIFTLVINFSEYLPTKLQKLIQYIGKNSLSVFLLHPFIIHFMHSIDPYFLGGPFLAYIITLFLNLGIPLLLDFLFTYQKEKFLGQ